MDQGSFYVIQEDFVSLLFGYFLPDLAVLFAHVNPDQRVCIERAGTSVAFSTCAVALYSLTVLKAPQGAL